MSAEGEAARAEAAVIDAEADAAARAEQAAAVATANAAALAADAEASARQRTEEIAAAAGQAIDNQEQDISWLRNHATETASRLTAQTERADRLETGMTAIAEQFRLLTERLTPPPSPPEPPPANPENLQPQGEGEGVRREAEPSPKQQGRKHRFV